MSQIRLQCIHRNRLFRQCLAKLLSETDRFNVAELDHTQSNVTKAIARERPNVVLIDLHLPERQSVELTRYIRERLDATVVLLLSGSKHSEYDRRLVLDCLEAGAQGYVLEDSSVEDLKAALENVIEGHMFCSPRLMTDMMLQLADFSRDARLRTRMRPSVLTQREIEILEWVAEGLSNKQVARKLSLSLYTVKNHIHRILGKLQAHDRYEAVQHAVEQRLLSSASPALRMRI